MQIHCVPTEGFGNRIRFLASCAILTESLPNARLTVYWRPTAECNMHLTDILDPVKLPFVVQARHVDVSDVGDSTGVYTNQSTNTGDILHVEQFLRENPHIMAPPTSAHALILRGGHEFKPTQMDAPAYMQQKHQWYKRLFVSCLRPEMAEYISRTWYSLGITGNPIDSDTPILGVHYREYVPKYDAQDNPAFEQESSIDVASRIVAFFNKAFPRARILVVSNGTKLVDSLTEIPSLAPRIIQRRNYTSMERDDPDGMFDACVDFLMLSQCGHILGTHGSSFSDEACFVHNISKITFRIPDNHEPYAYHCYGLVTATLYNDDNLQALFQRKNLPLLIKVLHLLNPTTSTLGVLRELLILQLSRLTM